MASVGQVLNRNKVLLKAGSSNEEITRPKLDFVRMKCEEQQQP
jgi:hypothetical protein